MSVRNEKGLVYDQAHNVIEKCIQEILNYEGKAGTVLKKTKVMNIMLEKTKEKNKNLKNLTIDTEKIEIDQSSNLNLANKTGIAQEKIRNMIVKKVIQQIPQEYSKLLEEDINEATSTLIEAAQNPNQFITNITRQHFEKFLENLKNPFVNLSIENWKIETKRTTQQIECDLMFELKKDMKQPVVKIILKPPIVKNPLLKIKFRIDGEGRIAGMKISYTRKKLKIALGELSAKLNIIITEIKVLDMAVPSSQGDVIYIASKEFKHEFKEISIAI